MIREYYDILEKNKEFFDRSFEIAGQIAKKAREIFDDCEVYIAGSFAREEHKLSSDLDILIESRDIPKKIEFEWFSKVAKTLTDDHRVNIYLINREKFREVEKMCSPRIRIL